MSFLRPASPDALDFREVYAEVVREAPTSIRLDNLRISRQTASSAFDKLLVPVATIASVSFCVFAIMTSLNDPDYYSRKLIESLLASDLDTMRTGATAEPVSTVEGLPVPTIVRAKPLKPADYQIVMIYDGEAILATDDELMRVRVGSVLPGLGEVKEIVQEGSGGLVNAEFATLRAVAN